MEPFGNVPVRIDNRKLDGFIDFFNRKYDCRLGCRDCHYCDDWVETAVRFEGDALAYSGRITRTLDPLRAGRLPPPQRVLSVFFRPATGSPAQRPQASRPSS